mmetsp:Transcript_2854/g.7671  ORF Transcript_2854/g.7671 Transcript_2854/m.7671 type:complete len:190 (-) Transcript_2854:470-1039(-)
MASQHTTFHTRSHTSRATCPPTTTSTSTSTSTQRRQRAAAAAAPAAAAAAAAADKGGKGGKGGKPAGGKAVAAAPAPDGGRPFSQLTWALPAGNFSPASLGWRDAEGCAPSGVPDVQPSAQVAEGTTVAGLDTPCHRAGIRAYRACLERVEASMRSGLGDTRALLTTWVKDEVLWQKTWAGLLKEMEGL